MGSGPYRLSENEKNGKIVMNKIESDGRISNFLESFMHIFSFVAIFFMGLIQAD